ncbi:hypothetical protein M3484_08315 [Pseudomonas sp. GX19020]|uniref:hypothetical protein n=1 Tax=Pseudomonas sp. GX19020 TaxID=2942277 RepID=UPI002019F5CA|nr:hypothetical protein [Pseudomonas sp. GX19020]MCL4066574.1 hypothetical protein [Pseudomonas sp. GX19020]
MGSDPEAIINPLPGFDGITALRAVNDTVMPHVVLSNDNAATIMIAEKAAVMILAPHGLQGATA